MRKPAMKRPRLPKPNPKPEKDPRFPIVLSSDDADLSIKIVEKATLRASGNPSTSATELKEKMSKTKGRPRAQFYPVVQGTEIENKYCIICKTGGHRAKDCTASAKVCLNCGDSGHEMFSCKIEYSLDDLKEIQCYVCKCFGHLCCAKYSSESSRVVSCNRCGQLGHSGLECARVHEETNSKWTPSSCFICGEEAHMACKCTAYSKKQKKKMEFPSARKNKYSRRKRKKTQPSTSQPKPRVMGGYITEVPRVYNDDHGWEYSKTPAVYITNHRFHGANGYQSFNDRFHDGNGYQLLNDRIYGSNGYESSNIRFHGGNGYQSVNDRFHGSNAYQSFNDRFHGGSGYNLGHTNPGFYSNQGSFQYQNAVGFNGYPQRFYESRYGNSSIYGNREYGWG